MRLETDTIILKPLEKDDIEYIHSKTSDYANIRPYFSTKIRSKNYWIERFDRTGLWDDQYGMLGIIDKASGTMIGVIWFFHSLPYAEGYEIGFNIFVQNPGNSRLVATAVRVFSSYLFHTYNINRLQCNTLLDRDHPGIESFSKDTNFVFEGTMREAMYIRGQLVDLQLFSLLREESPPLDELVRR